MAQLSFDDTASGLTRSQSPAADAILGKPIRVLDAGHVTLVNYLGTDEDIVRSARVSYGAGTRPLSEDEALIDYLYRHAHTSPFEMVELVFHIKLPIFVERQLSRHRTASQNQESARYSIMSRDVYVPDPGRLAKQSKDNKQGSGEPLGPGEVATALEVLRDNRDSARRAYDTLVDEDGPDLARELARTTLTVANYTELIWKQDLHNLLHLIALRWDEHAQWEIRRYAEAMAMCVEKVAPVAYRAFLEHRKGAARLSATELAVVRDLAGGWHDGYPEYVARAHGLKGRKLREFLKKIA